MAMADPGFFRGKRVLLTGHTGFKGSWMCVLLEGMGAEVHGYSLDPPTEPSLYSIAGVGDLVDSEIGDIRDFDRLESYYSDVAPDIVIHMAAQPIVREGYRVPRYTYETNVMGTVNILECQRLHPTARSFLNVTTDKVYDNNDTDRYYRESDPLDGYDPYSNSKSCSELVTHSYRRSFLSEGCAVSTARAGNVIGGGDFAKDRIVPDCVAAARAGRPIELRNPNSIRPYQHVLEPLHAYLGIVRAQWSDRSKADAYNVGPRSEDCVTTGRLADMFCECWGDGARWVTNNDDGPHEANFLKLDSTHIRESLGFEPRWHIEDAVARTVEWTKAWLDGEDTLGVMRDQIKAYGGM